MSPEDRFRLEDMRSYANEAVVLLGDLSSTAVVAERIRELALTRLVEVVGEAAARVSPDVRARHPDLPWKEAIGLRNILVHGYGQVRTDILVATVRDHFPALIRRLDDILQGQTP